MFRRDNAHKITVSVLGNRAFGTDLSSSFRIQATTCSERTDDTKTDPIYQTKRNLSFKNTRLEYLSVLITRKKRREGLTVSEGLT